MPILPENRARYPADWPQISARIRFGRAGGYCERCSAPHNIQVARRNRDDAWLDDGTPPKLPGIAWIIPPVPVDPHWREAETGRRLEAAAFPPIEPDIPGGEAGWRLVLIVLTCAHLDHQPENCADDNLLALCQLCHNRHDAQHRRANRAQRRRQGKAVGDLFEGKSA